MVFHCIDSEARIAVITYADSESRRSYTETVFPRCEISFVPNLRCPDGICFDTILEMPDYSKASVERNTKAARRLLQMHFESGVGHIGGNLSALDLMLVLHHDVMNEQDQFVLSKGHAAGALYITLWSLGIIDEEELKTFHRDGTRLAGHPPPNGLDEILFATGSLGHGLGLANGLALAKKLLGQTGRVYCLTSDGEWNEGSNWESLIFARHHELSNLTVVIDMNGLQGFGTTKEVADLSPLINKFGSFGVDTQEVDGHNPHEIATALGKPSADGPSFVIARTVKGNRVSYMQNRMEWHYLPMNQEQYLQAMSEVKDP
jgi:transketolase